MSEEYFVIGANDEGVTFVQRLSAGTLAEELKENGWLPPEAAMADMPTPNPAHWHSQYILIKGEIVMPQPVEVVTGWGVK